MPRGNPNITQWSWTTDRPEPLLARLQLRVPQTLHERVTSLDNWQEFVRQAIVEKLEREANDN